MSIQAQRLIVGEGGQVTFRVPRPAGTPLRILILDDAQAIDPTNNPELSQKDKQGQYLDPPRDPEQTHAPDLTRILGLTDAERLQLGALAAVTDDDPAEDALWERYLHG